MLKRNWRWLILLGLAVAYAAPWRDLDQDCLNSIQIGMNVAEARSILAQHGYSKGPGGGVRSGGATMAFERRWGGRRIIVSWSTYDGRVLGKGFGEDRTLSRLRERIFP
jgi:hypothetical protein